jgi:hypothetical protein
MPLLLQADAVDLYQHMIDDVDVNVGVILEGPPVQMVGKQIFIWCRPDAASHLLPGFQGNQAALNP